MDNSKVDQLVAFLKGTGIRKKQIEAGDVDDILYHMEDLEWDKESLANYIRFRAKMSDIHDYATKIHEDYMKNWNINEHVGSLQVDLFHELEPLWKTGKDHFQAQILQHIFEYGEVIRYSYKKEMMNTDEMQERDEEIDIVFGDHWLYEKQEEYKRLYKEDPWSKPKKKKK